MTNFWESPTFQRILLIEMLQVFLGLINTWKVCISSFVLLLRWHILLLVFLIVLCRLCILLFPQHVQGKPAAASRKEQLGS